MNRNEAHDEAIHVPAGRAHGYDWNVLVYPRGHRKPLSSPRTDDDDKYVSCYVVPAQAVTAAFSFRCRDTEVSSDPKRFDLFDNSLGKRDFLKRDRFFAENCLEADGSLVLEIGIRIGADSRRVWYPEKLTPQDIWVKLYRDESTSDVAFSVGETVFWAHKSILSLRGKKLYELAEECNDDSDNDENDNQKHKHNKPIPIHAVRAEIFESLLAFVYTVATPEINTEEKARELLVAADCYECTHLKLYAESVLVDRFLRPANAADLLLFADAHSCALLLEAAMDVFCSQPEAVKQTKAWSDLKQSPKLLLELVDSLTKCPMPSEVEKWDVAQLRTELAAADIALDGSKQVLLERLHALYKNSSQPPQQAAPNGESSPSQTTT